MKIIETKAYEFNELSEEAKEKAIEEFRSGKDIHLDFFDDCCVEKLEDLGFINPKLEYSLSYCQGDGLSFSAKGYAGLENLYIKRLGEDKRKTAKILLDNTTFICKGNQGRYCFAHTSDIDIYIENYTSSINTNLENIDKVVSDVLADLQDIYMEICGELEKEGYDDIEYQLSDESIIEEIICNEYEFTEEGDLI